MNVVPVTGWTRVSGLFTMRVDKEPQVKVLQVVQLVLQKHTEEHEGLCITLSLGRSRGARVLPERWDEEGKGVDVGVLSPTRPG